MKKLGLYLLTIWLIVCCGLAVACKEKDKTKQLNAPQNLVLNGAVLSWDEVTNASGYLVCYEDKQREINKCRYDLSALTEPATYTIQVQAKGDGEKFLDSEFASIAYTVTNKGTVVTPKPSTPDTLPPTENLSYKLTADGSGYKVSIGKATLTDTLVIPASYNDLPVKEVGSFATYEQIPGSWMTQPAPNRTTTSIYLPDTVEIIYAEAFQNFEILMDVEIPSNLKSIGARAFANDKLLRKVILPEGLLEIEEEAFQGCTNLAEIYFPNSLQTVGANVLNKTAWLEQQPNGLVIKNHVLLAYKGELDSHLEIPSTVKYIAANALIRANMQSVTIPDGVTLSESVFQYCKSLKTVRLPQDITSIPQNMFRGCSALENIELPEGVVEIQSQAFNSCTSLTNLILPSTLKTIGAKALYSTAITYLALPDGVENVNGLECATLKELVVSNAVNNISKAKNLEKIYYNGSVEDWQTHIPADITLPTGATVYYYSETQPSGEGNYWHFINGIATIW